MSHQVQFDTSAFLPIQHGGTQWQRFILQFKTEAHAKNFFARHEEVKFSRDTTRGQLRQWERRAVNCYKI